MLGVVCSKNSPLHICDIRDTVKETSFTKQITMTQIKETLEPIVCEIELTYRPTIKPSQRPQVNSAKASYEHFILLWDKDKLDFVEQFKVMLLNRANRVLGICTLTSGSATQTVADPRQIFAAALKANAPNLILAHNHPSGNLKPSGSDEELTKKLVMAASFLELRILDHLIITSEGYYSFADEGTL